MFCKECGSSIPDDAKFCPVCGANQENNGEMSDSYNVPPPPSSTQKSLVRKAIQKMSKVLAYYSIWVFIHLSILLIASDGIFSGSNMEGTRYFWPFGRSADIDDYDITEFIFYVIFPLVYVFIRGLMLVSREDKEEA